MEYIKENLKGHGELSHFKKTCKFNYFNLSKHVKKTPFLHLQMKMIKEQKTKIQ